MATLTKYPTGNTATTGFNGSGINPTDAYTDNTTYATFAPSKPRNDEDAHCWHGFDFSSIPDGSTINSVTVKIQEYVSSSWTQGEWRATLWADATTGLALTRDIVGSITGANITRATTDTSEFEWDLGTLSTEPTLAQLKSSNFGVRIEAAQGNNSTSHTFYVDVIEITVDYTAPTPTPVLEQSSFRWRNDDGSETAATWLAAADTDVTVRDQDLTLRLRLLLELTGAAVDATTDWRLVYRKNGGSWTTFAAGTDMSMALSDEVTDGTATTQQLGSGTLGTGEIVESTTSSEVTNDALAVNQEAEFEWVVEVHASGVTAGDYFEFAAQYSPDGAGFQNADTLTAIPKITVGNLTPSITSVTPSTVYHGLTGIDIVGDYFEATQGVGSVKIGQGSSPVIEDVTSGADNTAASIQSFTMPSTVAADDLLIMVMSTSKSNASVSSIDYFTEIFDETYSTNDVSLFVGVYEATGSEDGETKQVILSMSTMMTYAIYRISGGVTADDVSVSVANTDISTTPDPPPLTADGDYWIAVAAGSWGNTLISYPTGYTDETGNVINTGDNDGVLAWASKAETDTIDNPPTFTFEYSDVWIAATIGVGGGLTNETQTITSWGDSAIEFTGNVDALEVGAATLTVEDQYGLSDTYAVTISSGVTTRKAQVSWAELGLPDAARRAEVSWSELEFGNAARRAEVSWTEIEFATAPRRGQVSWTELEVATAPRSAEVSWLEFEFASAPRAGQISWVEFELPDEPTVSGQVSWVEFETPDGARKAEISWAELEFGDAARRALISWEELEFGDGARRAWVSWAELEFATAPRRVEVSWLEFEFATAPRKAEVSWVQLDLEDAARGAEVSWAAFEFPTPPMRGRISFVEFETPSLPRGAEVSWVQVDLFDAARGAEVSWLEMEMGTAARGAQVSWTELEFATAPRSGEVSWVVLDVPSLDQRKAEVSWLEMEVPVEGRGAEVSWVEAELPTAARSSEVSWVELEVPEDARRHGQVSWIEFGIASASIWSRLNVTINTIGGESERASTDHQHRY